MADLNPFAATEAANGELQPHRQRIRVSAVGYLKKKNRWRFYQKRYFELDGVDLKYYRNKEKKTPAKCFRIAGASLNGRFGDFDVETETRDLELRADNLEDAELWVESIERAEEEEEQRALEQNRPPPKPKEPITLTPMEGYLELPSGVRFKPWHDRFCRLGHSSLFYYENDIKAQDDYEGEILLSDASSPTRPTVELMEGSKNKGFIVRVGQKEYKFKAPSPDAAKDWMDTIEQRILNAYRQPDSEQEEKSELPSSGMPKWIQDWDAQTDGENVNRIQEHLINTFPPPNDPDFQKNTLNAVTLLLDELDDKARECLPADGRRGGLTISQRESRPDIFEVIIRFFHIRIVNELSQFVSDQSYENLTVRELLRFMDLITAYDSKIKEILHGEVGEAILNSLPRFDLLDNAENMALRYSKVCEQQINSWVENVIVETKVQGESRVFVRVDGRYQTPGPTDIFNMMDQALQLGKVSGLKPLQAEIVAMCAANMGYYIVSVTDDMAKRSRDSLPLACAMANDCWLVLEHLDKLQTENRNDNYRVELESIQEQCAVSADKCLETISAMAISDLRPTLDQLFTQQHLASVVDTDDIIAVVCATIDDYLEDLQVLLEIQFVIRASRMIVRDIVASYLARLAHAYAVDRRISLTKREINLIDLDRKRLIEGLQGRFPTWDVARIFATELQPLDDVIEMLCAAPALVPQLAVRIAQRDSYFGPYLRQSIINAAKMCVDLSVNGQGGNDKLVKEIKGMIVIEVEEAISAPSSAPIPEDKSEFFERMAYTRMWPQIKKPAVKRVDASTKPVNTRVALRKQIKIIEMEAPVEKAPRQIQREASVHWQQFARQGGTQAPPSDGTSGVPILLTPLVSGMLRFKADAKSQHVSYFCALRPISETHQTDYELVVFNGRSAANPKIYRVRIADVSRVSFWDESGPKHFGSDGKVVDDVMPIGVNASNNSIVDFAVAKNASEFVIVNRSNEKVHLKADSAAEAQEWVANIRECVEDSFEKWGLMFVEGQQEYAKMKISQLLELGAKRGLDMRGLTEKSELIRVLKNNGPLLPTATSAKEASKAAVVETQKKPTLPPSAKPDVTAARNPQLNVNESLPESKKDVEQVTAKNNLKVTMSMPAASAVPIEQAVPAKVAAPTTVPKSAQPVVAKAQDPVIAKKTTEPVAAAPLSSTNGTQATAGSIRPHVASSSVAGAARADIPPPTSSAPKPALAVAAAAVPPVQRAVTAPAIPAASTVPGLNADETQLIEAQTLITRGHMLIEEGQYAQASQIFRRAKELAKALNNIQLEAKSNRGLAASYREQPNMLRASGTLYEVAAQQFGLSGDHSDRLTCIQEAVEVFLKQGRTTEAISAMENYDRAARRTGQPVQFEERIRTLRGA